MSEATDPRDLTQPLRGRDPRDMTEELAGRDPRGLTEFSRGAASRSQSSERDRRPIAARTTRNGRNPRRPKLWWPPSSQAARKDLAKTIAHPDDLLDRRSLSDEEPHADKGALLNR
jgi:hypothetical protein